MADDEQPRGSQDPTRLSEEDLRDGASRTEDLAGSRGSGGPGPRRLGDFELIRELGRGGMGVVYEARQISLKRRVALKVLPPAIGLTPQARQRFEREAQAAAKLHHTNIVPVHAIGEDEDHHFYAMDLIEGQSLDQVLRQLVEEGSNPLLAETVTKAASQLPKHLQRPPESTRTSKSSGGLETSLGDTSTGSRTWFDVVAKLIAGVADGLDYAHGRGVIHRDIKPANLMLSNEGRLCITDFGLARIVQEPGMTVSGSFLGTPAYMSPEQIAAGRMKLDHRTDVYSLGAVLYEMLTLQRPFPGDSREEVIGAIMTKDPRPPRRFNGKIPVDLETICLKALEKDPDQRYPTAGALAQDLRQYLQDGLIAARRAGPARRAAKWIRRHPVFTIAAVAMFAVAAVGALAWKASIGQSTEAVRRAIADARLAENDGAYRLALQHVEEALAIDPRLPDARLIQARLLMELERVREAYDAARALVEEDPDNWTAHLLLASLARGGWDLSRRRIPTIFAEDHIRVVESKAPETADALYLRSLVAATPYEALELLDRALELDPGHADALEERVHRYEQIKDFPAALQDCERLSLVKPRSTGVRRTKAMVLRWSGDRLGALAEMNAAVEVDSQDPENYDHRARALAFLGKHHEAVQDLTRAIDLDPGRAPYHWLRADYLSVMGRNEEAINDARRALELDPDLRFAYVVLVHAHLQLGQREQAREVLAELASAAEDWLATGAQAWSRGRTAEALLLLGEPEQALDEVSRAIDIQPDNHRWYLLRSRTKLGLGDRAGAQADCDAAARIVLDTTRAPDIRIDALQLGQQCNRWDLAREGLDRLAEDTPRWHLVHTSRCMLNVFTGQLETALADCTRTIELTPRNPWAYANRGVIYERMHRPDESLEDTAKAVEFDPYNAGLRLNYAEFLFDAGRVDEARTEISAAIDLDRRDPLAYVVQCRQLAHEGRCEEALHALSTTRELLAASPEPEYVLGYIAWAQVHAFAYGCPDHYDSPAVLEDARAAVEKYPKDTTFLIAHGAALYRNGQYEDAEAVLLDAVEQSGDASSYELFLLALVSARLGEMELAGSYHERGVEWMELKAPDNPVLGNLRRESSRLSRDR